MYAEKNQKGTKTDFPPPKHDFCTKFASERAVFTVLNCFVDGALDVDSLESCFAVLGPFKTFLKHNRILI